MKSWISWMAFPWIPRLLVTPGNPGVDAPKLQTLKSQFANVVFIMVMRNSGDLLQRLVHNCVFQYFVLKFQNSTTRTRPKKKSSSELAFSKCIKKIHNFYVRKTHSSPGQTTRWFGVILEIFYLKIWFCEIETFVCDAGLRIFVPGIGFGNCESASTAWRISFIKSLYFINTLLDCKYLAILFVSKCLYKILMNMNVWQ